MTTSDMHTQRYSLWVEHTDRGTVLRDAFRDKNEAINSARKYWLTTTGLFRAFVCDSDASDAVIFDRVREPIGDHVVRESFAAKAHPA